ncbi:class I SAM-dependent methyltransferase [Haloferax namakaokahaiae]|uniref:Class I SAM-dependent methyltransferase n=1 Tax=Haloferax namakaokahaiae TaxID=1748331 RepID=A0ABD5ZBZ9_9EURY
MNANDVRRAWADRSGEFSPEYYAYYGPNDTSEAIRRVLDDHLDPTDAVLELGCGPGRHLSHLHDHGFENLHGIDINEESFAVMEEAYPDLYDAGTFYADAIETAVERFDDGEFDAIYSVETLQHIHPDDEWVFAPLARATSDVLVTIENEGEDGAIHPQTGIGVNDTEYDFPLYYRDWNDVFTQCGLTEIATDRAKKDTIRVFRQSA